MMTSFSALHQLAMQLMAWVNMQEKLAIPLRYGM